MKKKRVPRHKKPLKPVESHTLGDPVFAEGARRNVMGIVNHRIVRKGKAVGFTVKPNAPTEEFYEVMK